MRAIFSVPVLARAAVALLCAKIAVVTLYVDTAAFLPYSHVKALASYSLSFVLLGVLVALALTGGRVMLTRSPLHVAALLFAAAYAAAAAFALNTDVALAGADGRFLGLYTVLDAILVYFTAALVLPHERGLVRWVAITLGAVVLIQLAVEVLQIAHVVSGRTRSDRPVGTTGNPDPLGVLTAVLAAGALGVAAAPSAARWVRIAAAAVAVAALGGWLLSGTRSPIAGLALTALVLAVLWAASAPAGAPRLRRFGAIAAIGVAGVVGVMLSPMGERVVRIAGSAAPLLAGDIAGVDKNVAGRLDHYRVSLDAFADRPLLGVGPDNYVAAWHDYRLPGTRQFHRSYGLQTSTHGWPFKLITDAGSAGLVAFIAAIVIAVALALRRWRDPYVLGALGMLATYLAGSAFAPNSTVTEWIPWLALGVIAAAASPDPAPAVAPAPATAEPAPATRRGRRSARRRRGGAFLAVSPSLQVAAAIAIAVGVLLAATPLTAWGAARVASDARAQLRGNANALPAAQHAVELDPRRPSYWNLVALASRRADREPDAQAAFQRAAALAPFDITWLMNAAQSQLLLASKGDKDAPAKAVDLARRAAGIDPFRPDVHFVLAISLYDAKDYEGSAAESEVGRMRDERGRDIPDFGYETAARSYGQLKRPEDVRRWCELGLATDIGKNRQIILRLLLARALIDLGQRDAALEQVNKVLALDDANADAKQLKRELQPSP